MKAAPAKVALAWELSSQAPSTAIGAPDGDASMAQTAELICAVTSSTAGGAAGGACGSVTNGKGGGGGGLEMATKGGAAKGGGGAGRGIIIMLTALAAATILVQHLRSQHTPDTHQFLDACI